MNKEKTKIKLPSWLNLVLVIAQIVLTVVLVTISIVALTTLGESSNMFIKWLQMNPVWFFVLIVLPLIILFLFNVFLLVKSLMTEKEGAVAALSHEELLEEARRQAREELEKELAKIANGFEFFYATRNNLQNKHQTALNSLNFPLRGELVELGTLSSNNQYPFTAYITKKFEEKIRTYFSDDFKGELTISLDKPIENGFEEYGSMADLISNESQNNINYIPDYDAKDASDNILGWKIKTFAGIVEKSVDTLRRWEKRGLIKPKRYEIYSPIQHKKIYYRAYTKDHVKQAKNINNIMDKKKRHQT